MSRHRNKLTQVDVAKLTGINNKTLSGYENAVSEPDYDSLVKLSILYKFTSDYLLGLTENPDLVCIDNLHGDPFAPDVPIPDPCLSEITKNLNAMTPEEKEAIRRLTQSIANRQTKDVG